MPDPTYEPLTWDNVGERLYNIGVDHGILFPYDSSNNTYGAGVAWSGLTNVSEKPSGAEPTPIYADNIKYLNLMSTEEFAATIEAIMYPDEFAECDGSAEIAPGVRIGQQKRKLFGFAYRTKIGNDVDGNDHGYEWHLVYGCLAAPTEVAHGTINDSPDVSPMSWEISTTPIDVTGKKPTAHITISSLKVDSTKWTALDTMLTGSTTAPSTLPTIAQLLTIFGTGNG